MQANVFWLKQNTLFHPGKKKNKFDFLQRLVLG